MDRMGYLIAIGIFITGITIGLIISPVLIMGDEDRDRDLLYQVSTISSLMEGMFEGTVSYEELRA